MLEDPDAAVPVPGVTGCLSALADRWGLVAVISGRPVQFLEAVLPRHPALVLVGVHGLEARVDGEVRTRPEAALWVPVVAQVAAQARRSLPPGVGLDDKGVTLALHWRRAPENQQLALAWADEAAAGTGLVAVRGRMSVELRPPVPLDKGTVAEELSSGLDAVCFVGDDRSDLPAFAAMRRARASGKTTVAVGVNSPEAPAELAEAVDVLVDGPIGVLGLMGYLAEVDAR